MPYSPLAGHDPSQRAQVLDSRNLVTSDYNAPNWMTGDGDVGMWGSEHSNTPMLPGTQYVLYDNRTNKVLGSGSTPEAFKSMLDIINGTLVPQGNNANWRLLQMGSITDPTDIHTRNPSPVGGAMQIDGQWGTPVAGDVPNHFLTDKLLPMLAPVAGAALGYFGGNALLGAGGGGGGAAGGGLSSITGSSAANAVLPGLSGTVTGVPAATGLGSLGAIAGGTVPATALAPLAEIVVHGVPLAGGLGATGTGVLSGVATGAGALSSLGGTPATPPSAPSMPTTADLNQIVAAGHVGLTPAQITALAAGLGGAGALSSLGGGTPANGPSTTANPSDQITVSGHPPVTGVPNPPIVVPPVVVPPVNVPQVPTSTTPPKSTIDKIIDYTRLAGLGIGTLGNLFGGSGSGSSGAAGFGQHSDYFNDSNLGPATIPGLAPGTGGARDMSGIDWAHYGEGPEQSFFNYVPQTPKHLAHGGAVTPSYESLSPSERNTVDYSRRNMATGIVQRNPDGSLTTFKGAVEDFPDGTIRYFPTYWNGAEQPLDVARQRAVNSGIDWPRFPSYEAGLQREEEIHRLMAQDADQYQRGDRSFLRGYAHGGALSQVSGPGDGREDKIPAMLSDGEYVVDAETVALLGNGSNKAGAQKLDQLRVKIRKQKGKALAKGSFSSDAKQPEHYLGGRV